MEKIADKSILGEISYKASPSSGPGGQHANKVSTRVEAAIDIPNSMVLTEAEKHLLLSRLRSRIDKAGILRAMDQTSRSQSANKERAKQKLIDLITEGLKKRKKRIPTKMSAAQKRARLKNKRSRSQTKKMREAVKREDF